MTYFLLIIGLSLLLIGANYLVDSSVAIAQRAKMSNFLIGLTIVGIGTSAPELYISITSALNGHGDMSLGNVIGSNISNVFLILGVSAAIKPFAIQRQTLKRDIPFNIIGCLVLFIICAIVNINFKGIDFVEGLCLLLIFSGYMWNTVRSEKLSGEYEEAAETKMSKFPLYALIIFALISLGALLLGGQLFLDSAIEMAQDLGLSEAVISISLVALGTSLPELITCIMAALKGNSQLALGNVLGSNIFNIFLILGVSSVISPIGIQNIYMADFGVLIASAVLVFVTAFTFEKKVIDRTEGIIFIVLYLIYNVYLLCR